MTLDAPSKGGYRLLLTVTTNLACPVLPLESVASHVTTVRPILKRLPDR
jgi:hypothetical protein